MAMFSNEKNEMIFLMEKNSTVMIVENWFDMVFLWKNKRKEEVK